MSSRERTEFELRTYLENKRVEPESIEAAVVELTAGGFLNDADYARRFAEDRRSLRRWGRERIARDLHKRGVAAGLVEAALADQDAQGELHTALELLKGRWPQPPSDDRERDRAWRLLVRRGYDTELAYEAVRRHAGGPGQAHAA